MQISWNIYIAPLQWYGIINCAVKSYLMILIERVEVNECQVKDKNI